MRGRFEGVQAIIDLDERQVIQVMDTGVIPVPTDTHAFDEATMLMGLTVAGVCDASA